jgi:predicted transcriptional regulator
MRNNITVLPLFETKVFTISIDDSIGGALKIMTDNSFSQLPIFKRDKFIDLLTNNTISRWLGSCVEEDIFSLRETKIGEVLEYRENPDSYFFLNGDATLSEAMDKFQYFESLGQPLEAILITKAGSTSEPLLGIITRSDFPKLLHNLSVSGSSGTKLPK